MFVHLESSKLFRPKFRPGELLKPSSSCLLFCSSPAVQVINAICNRKKEEKNRLFFLNNERKFERFPGEKL